MLHTFTARPAASRKGFTLLEVVVVLVIVAILGAVSFTAYSVLVRKANTKALQTTAWSIDHEAMAMAAVTGEAPVTTIGEVLNDPGNGFQPVPAGATAGARVAPASYRAADQALARFAPALFTAPAAAPVAGDKWVKGGATVTLNTQGGYELTKTGADNVCYIPADVVETPGIVRVLDALGCDAANPGGPPSGPSPSASPTTPGPTPSGSTPAPTPSSSPSTTPATPPIVIVSVNDPGPNPFVPANPVPDTVVADPLPPGNNTPSDPDNPTTINLSDPAPKVYAAPEEAAPRICNVDQMVSALTTDPAVAAAWAGAQGIQTSAVEAFVRDLAPVQLLRDVRVTNYSYSAGSATSFQAVLRAGDVVLVDSTGAPRARCRCGNPLAPPNMATPAVYSAAVTNFAPVVLSPMQSPACQLNVVNLTHPEIVAGLDITSGGHVAGAAAATWCPAPAGPQHNASPVTFAGSISTIVGSATSGSYTTTGYWNGGGNFRWRATHVATGASWNESAWQWHAQSWDGKLYSSTSVNQLVQAGGTANSSATAYDLAPGKTYHFGFEWLDADNVTWHPLVDGSGAPIYQTVSPRWTYSTVDVAMPQGARDAWDMASRDAAQATLTLTGDDLDGTSALPASAAGPFMFSTWNYQLGVTPDGTWWCEDDPISAQQYGTSRAITCSASGDGMMSPMAESVKLRFLHPGVAYTAHLGVGMWGWPDYTDTFTITPPGDAQQSPPYTPAEEWYFMGNPDVRW